MGSKRNGEFLALASAQFEVFLTAGRNLSYQQDLSSFNIAIIVLAARSNRFDDLLPLIRGFSTPLMLRRVVPLRWSQSLFEM
jgi:hypothetical protein